MWARETGAAGLALSDTAASLCERRRGTLTCAAVSCPLLTSSRVHPSEATPSNRPPGGPQSSGTAHLRSSFHGQKSSAHTPQSRAFTSELQGTPLQATTVERATSGSRGGRVQKQGVPRTNPVAGRTVPGAKRAARVENRTHCATSATESSAPLRPRWVHPWRSTPHGASPEGREAPGAPQGRPTVVAAAAVNAPEASPAEAFPDRYNDGEQYGAVGQAPNDRVGDQGHAGSAPQNGARHGANQVQRGQGHQDPSQLGESERGGNEALGAGEEGSVDRAASRRARMLRELQKEHEFMASKMFFYPPAVQAGGHVEVFFHRQASELKGQAGIAIQGGFNSWRWGGFQSTLLASQELVNDWWTVRLAVPPEAYVMNFVFHSSEGAYENNGGEDFFIAVEGGWGRERFEALLEEQKREAAAKAAAEQAERERQAREERRARDLAACEEAERAEARRLADDARERLGGARQGLATRQAGVWYTDPEPMLAGGTVEVFYNRALRPLASCPRVYLHAGVNNWERGVRLVSEMEFHSSEAGDWWKCEVEIPEEAVVLNWVLADGPAGGASLWDNNGRRDFAAPVGDEGHARGVYARLEAGILQRLRAQRARREEAAAALAGTVELSLALASRLRDPYKFQEAVVSSLQLASRVVDSYRDMYPFNWDFAHLERRVLRQLEEERERREREGARLLASLQQFDRFVGEFRHEWDVPAEFEWMQQRVRRQLLEERQKGEEEQEALRGAHAAFHRFARRFWDPSLAAEFHSGEGGAPLERHILQQLHEERRRGEEKAADLARRRAALRAATRARTKAAFLRSQAHVFFTVPAEPRAGRPVEVFYNPSSTALHGRTRVWMKGSFNRWSHPSGGFMPLEMVPSPNGTHFVAQVTPPEDAYVMDLDFLDSFDPVAAAYDNRGGLDYHVPLSGASLKEPPLHIVHVALEMAPVAKVGGLGDVVTSLSRAVMDLGHLVEVVLPKYDCLKYKQIQGLEQRGSFFWGSTTWRCWVGQVEGIPTNFLEPENGMFWVNCVYGRKDDAERFLTFCNAALEFLVQTGRNPDILHCHDWSSAPVAWLHRERYREWGLGKARSVFTIHNLEFGQDLIGKAMEAATMATTVSPTYAREISGNPAVRPSLGKFHGILNGIDPDIWDPLVDKFIPVNYSAEEVVAGKRAARRALWDRLGLRREEVPLVGIVSRLTAQKGIHLIKRAIYRTLELGGQAVLLGSAPDPRVQRDFENLAAHLAVTHGDMAHLRLSYDEPLSHLIYAACDIIVVPSMFEPCGLTQLIAMRYGAIPVVRKTGGLNDTVFDVDDDKERAARLGLETNGFSFEGADEEGLDYGLNRAIKAWKERKPWWDELAQRVMEQDWSWNRPSLDYLELYYGAKK